MAEINPPTAAAATALPSSDLTLPQSTVLVVDDNPQNVELLAAFLEALPVKIVTAVDGVDALEKVRAHNPDLILLDIMMPRMSGFGVCEKWTIDTEKYQVVGLNHDESFIVLLRRKDDVQDDLDAAVNAVLD